MPYVVDHVLTVCSASNAKDNRLVLVAWNDVLLGVFVLCCHAGTQT